MGSSRKAKIMTSHLGYCGGLTSYRTAFSCEDKPKRKQLEESHATFTYRNLTCLIPFQKEQNDLKFKQEKIIVTNLCGYRLEGE